MMSVFCFVLAFLPMATSPEAEGVSSRKILQWLDASDREVDCMHGFVFLRHGKLIAEGSWKPFDTLNEPHFLSSHTKCFTTTAIGLLVEDGKLDLDDRVIDILPDKAPANPSENLKQLRVRDLMTMNTGWKNEGWTKDVDGDWAKAILREDFEAMPGCQYKYNSGATHLLGLIVARRSGKPYFDFVKERLFNKIGIEKAWMTSDPQGNPCAGWGLYLTTREISLMGQLHLQKGLWNGQRILSEDWVDLATTKQTWSGKTPKEFQPNNDWTYGFGFSWWRCQHGCYRADGACGQYTIIFPEHDAILSIHADVLSMQQILDVVWKHFLPVFAKSALPEDAEGARLLKDRCEKLALSPVAGRYTDVDAAFLGTDFSFKSAPSGLRGVRLEQAADGWNLTVRTDAGSCTLPVGLGSWKQSEMQFTNRKHQPLGWIVGKQPVATSGAVQDDGTVKVRIHMLNSPRRIDLTFSRKFFKPVVSGRIIGDGKFSSEKL